MRLRTAAAALLAVPAAFALDGPPFTAEQVFRHMTLPSSSFTAGGFIPPVGLLDDPCAPGIEVGGPYPGFVVGNRGPEEGYASRVLPVLVGGEFVFQAFVGPTRPGAPTDLDFFAGIEVDQTFPPGPDGLVFYFAGVRPSAGGTQVFASRNGNSNLGSAFFEDAAGAHVRIVGEAGEIQFEARACPTDPWQPFASTPLSDPSAFHAVGLGGSNLDPGSSLVVGLTGMEGAPPHPGVEPSVVVAVSCTEIYRRCIRATILLGSGVDALPEYDAVHGELAAVIVELQQAFAEDPTDKEFKKAARLVEKVDKAIARCEALAEKGKALAAQKATLKAVKAAGKAASAAEDAFLQE